MTVMPGTIQERIALPASARPGRAESARTVTAGDVLSMLRRRSVMLAVLLILFLGLAGGGFLAWWFYFPGYRGECLIECISNIPETGLTLEHERIRQEEHERFVATQALLLKSPTILETVLRLNTVHETDWYRRVRPDERLLTLTEVLVAAPVRGTNFLRVAMECRRKDDPSIIVNEVVHEWYESVTKRSAEGLAPELKGGQDEEEALDARVEEKRKELKGIADRLPPGARQDPANNITAQQVRQISEQVTLLRLERSQLEQYRDIYNNPRGVAATAEDQQIVEQDPQVAGLIQALFLLEQQRAADVLMFGEKHNVIRQLDAQIKTMDDKRAKLMLEKLSERQASIRQETNMAYDNVGYALWLAEESLAKAEAALTDQDRLLFEYMNLEAEITKDLEYKLKLNETVKGLERVVRHRTAVKINIAQPATKPLERSSPSLWLIPVGVFLALALSIGIVLALELLDTSVRTSQDVVRHLDVAMLGAVPDTDDEEIDIDRVETAVRDVPRSMVAEAFRRIRTNLQFSAPAERQRSLMVTSPSPNDGKTTVACNLAMAVAGGGRRVLLVDANFRRPALLRILGVGRAKGLSNLLIGEGSLEDIVARTNVPLLDLVAGGPIPPNPAELLGGPLWRTFLQTATGRYDQVIIDAAPVLLASDALVLATTVDGVVLVVRANENSRGVARRACDLLADVGAHLFGVVLNAAQVTRGGYFREQLRSFYEYQPEVDGADKSQAISKKT